MFEIIAFIYIIFILKIVKKIIPALFILAIICAINIKYKSKKLIICSISYILLTTFALTSFLTTDFSGDPPSYSNNNFLSFGLLSLISLIVLLIGIYSEYKHQKKPTKKKKKDSRQ